MSGSIDDVIIGTRGPVRGPCKHCGAMYRSYGAKIFCSLKCYIASGESAANARAHFAKATEMSISKGRVEVKCDDCGEVKSKPRSAVKKWLNFCGKACWRSYLARRFDRFVANPEDIALPQNYDEFLDRDELPCPVHSCGWVGAHLSMHANLVHGIEARDFKKLLGFNVRSALVGKAALARQSEIAKELFDAGVIGREFTPGASQGGVRGVKQSLESREHRVKAAALVPRAPRKLSDATLEKMRARALARRFRVRCADCGCDVESSGARRIRCEMCQHARMLASQRARQHAKEQRGECRSCASPRLPGLSMCAKHRDTRRR